MSGRRRNVIVVLCITLSVLIPSIGDCSLSRDQVRELREQIKSEVEDYIRIYTGELHSFTVDVALGTIDSRASDHTFSEEAQDIGINLPVVKRVRSKSNLVNINEKPIALPAEVSEIDLRIRIDQALPPASLVEIETHLRTAFSSIPFRVNLDRLIEPAPLPQESAPQLAVEKNERTESPWILLTLIPIMALPLIARRRLMQKTEESEVIISDQPIRNTPTTATIPAIRTLPKEVPPAQDVKQNLELLIKALQKRPLREQDVAIEKMEKTSPEIAKELNRRVWTPRRLDSLPVEYLNRVAKGLPNEVVFALLLSLPERQAKTIEMAIQGDANFDLIMNEVSKAKQISNPDDLIYAEKLATQFLIKLQEVSERQPT